MKALVKKKAAPGLWMEEAPMPTINDSDVLIKVRQASICGTDIHIYTWDEWAQKTIPVPMTIGHEFMGEIVEIGKAVQGFKIGDRVAGEGHITCGNCRHCREGRRHLCAKTIGVGVNRTGAFAEYISIPAENAFLLPDSIPDEIASICDPLGNAVHTALSFDMIGEDVLITGAGPIGLMSVAIARHCGARSITITDINDYRLTMAKQLGATHAINVAKTPLKPLLPSLGLRESFTVGLEMSGSPDAFRSMIDVVDCGARIALLGILPAHTEINWHQVIFKSLFIKGIYGREIFGTWYKMVHMIESGLNVKPIITHRFPMENFEEGFQTMLSGNSGKVVLHW